MNHSIDFCAPLPYSPDENPSEDGESPSTSPDESPCGEKRFRFHKIQAFLTYSDCDMEKEDLLSIMNQTYPVTKYAIGREKHRSGKWHLHAYFKFEKQIDSIKVELFDIRGYHPNIGKIKTVQACVEYCTKDGDFIMEGIDFFSTSQGFTNRSRDHIAWRKYRDNMVSDTCYPFTLPNGRVVNEPGLSEKKNNYLIISKPGFGKTPWAEDTFEGKKVMKRTPDETSWEDYDGQEVILYDDFYPLLSELIAVSNVYKTQTRVPGRCRYHPRYFKKNQRRTIIILANEAPHFADEEAFKARFTTILLNKPIRQSRS